MLDGVCAFAATSMFRVMSAAAWCFGDLCVRGDVVSVLCVRGDMDVSALCVRSNVVSVPCVRSDGDVSALCVPCDLVSVSHTSGDICVFNVFGATLLVFAFRVPVQRPWCPRFALAAECVTWCVSNQQCCRDMYSSGSVGNIYLVQISEIIRCPDGKFPDNFPKYDDVIPNWDIRIAMFGDLGTSWVRVYHPINCRVFELYHVFRTTVNNVLTSLAS